MFWNCVQQWFAVFYMNNTSFITKVAKTDTFKSGKFTSLS